MAYKPDYSKDLFKQVQDMIKKCDDLSSEIKEERKKSQKEKRELNEKIEKLESKVQKLEKENEKLRDDNDRLKKIINNNSDNSSKPPSTDIKKNIPNNREKSNKTKGGQTGHKGTGLKKSEIVKKIKNKEIEHKIINVGKPQGEFVSKYIIDIEVRAIAKEYRFYKDEKGKYNIPKEFKTDVQYGSEVKTLCTILNTEGIVAIDRLTKLVSCISHGKINISNGSIVNFIKDLSNKTIKERNEIKENLLNSKLMYTDATTLRCANRNMCVRNYSTEKYVYLVPTYGKSKKYIEETGILNKYTGNIVHDHETVIYNYGNEHIECNVHISRYLKGCFENTTHKWALKMRSFLCSLNEHRKRLIKEGVKEISLEKLEKYEERYDTILKEGYEENKRIKKKFLRQEEQRLLNRLSKYKENHIKFLKDFAVPFDNNLSERDLRNVKIKQKISGYFSNLEQATNFFNIKSIIMTLKKQGKDFYSEIYKKYEKNPINA